MKQKWIPISEKLPKDGEFVLTHIENFEIPDISRYEIDEEGNGAFYPCNDENSYLAYNLFVNAWMPLPEPYRVEEAKEREQQWKQLMLNAFLRRR